MHRLLAGCFSFVALTWLCLAISPCAAYAAPKPPPKTQYREIKKDLKAKQQKLSEAISSESTAIRSLEQTNKELLDVSKRLKKLQASLNRTAQRIEGMRGEVEDLEDKIAKRSDWMRAKIAAMYKYGKYGDAMLLAASSSDIGEMTRRWKFLNILAEYDGKVIDGYYADLEALEAKRNEIRELYANYRAEEKDIKGVEQELMDKKHQKEDILVSARKDKEVYKRMVRELRKSSARMQKMIKSAAEQEKRAPKKYAPTGGTFRTQKGRLAWPSKGKVAIPYGKQVDKDFQTPVFRNGIYIETPSDSVAKAVFDGKVVFADWFEGYGLLVIVNHGEGYHTLYANLSEIFLKTGDIIKSSDNVGRVGETGTLESPSLYFEIRYKGKPLDPASWLKQR